MCRVKRDILSNVCVYEKFWPFPTLFFVVFGNLEDFGLTLCNKKQSSVFLIEPEGINTSPMWFEKFRMQRGVAHVCLEKLFSFIPFAPQAVFTDSFVNVISRWFDLHTVWNMKIYGGHLLSLQETYLCRDRWL